jgi:tetratricopeptide (TPR) repeat protein
MKKILLTMLGVALIALPASAQMPGAGVSVAKVDVNKIKSEIAKSDADIADAKKSAKAATWIKRGGIFVDADAKPVNGIYVGMPENILKMSFGETAATQETIGSNTFTVYPYAHLKAYVSNGVVEFFVPVTVIDPQALDKAYDAYAKAYELDPKSAKAVGTGMGSIHTKSFENGGALYSLGDYKAAAANFRRAYKASAHPTSPSVDTLALYYAGMSGAFGEDHANALTDLDKAIEMGYEAEGEVYRLKFIALYNLNRKEEALEVIKAGIAKYPTNEDLIDMIMRYYAENDGDASSLIPMVEDAIAKNPDNPNLYQGLAGIYEKLGQLDNALATVKKAVGVAPDNFLANYYEGLYTMQLADKMANDLGKRQFTSNAQFQEALGEVTNIYRQALAPLEKAYSIDAKEAATVELLKSLTFRLREDSGMQEKYDKYTELLNSMVGE